MIIYGLEKISLTYDGYISRNKLDSTHWETNLFTTRAAAEAERDRRNKERIAKDRGYHQERVVEREAKIAEALAAKENHELLVSLGREHGEWSGKIPDPIAPFEEPTEHDLQYNYDGALNVIEVQVAEA